MKKSRYLRDSFNRRIDYLRISVTDRCNLRCIYCSPDKGLKRFKQTELLTSDEIVRFVSIACKHGLRKVRITGGEPLLKKDIVPLVRKLKDTGVYELSLTTNGLLLSRFAQKLKSAGLDRVNISLDTLDSAKYKIIAKGGNINEVLESIKEAERACLTPVKINVVPIRGLNDDEILSFASMTLDKNYHIRFIEFMPANCNGLWSEDRLIRAHEILERISMLGPLKPLKFKGMGPSRNYRIKNAPGVIGVISPISDHFCKYCNRLRLTALGRIRPCLFSNREIDIRTPMRKGAPDKVIEELFLQAVGEKPEGHNLNASPDKLSLIKSMSKIGG